MTRIIIGKTTPLQIQHGQTVEGTYPYIILDIEPHGSYIIVRQAVIGSVVPFHAPMAVQYKNPVMRAHP